LTGDDYGHPRYACCQLARIHGYLPWLALFCVPLSRTIAWRTHIDRRILLNFFSFLHMRELVQGTRRRRRSTTSSRCTPPPQLVRTLLSSSISSTTPSHILPLKVCIHAPLSLSLSHGHGKLIYSRSSSAVAVGRSEKRGSHNSASCRSCGDRRPAPAAGGERSKSLAPNLEPVN